MKKKIFVCMLCVCCALVSVAFAEGFADVVPYYTNDIAKEIIGNGNFSELIENISRGELQVSEDVISRIFDMIIPDVKICMSYIASVLGFCILASCVKGSSLRLSGSTGEIAFLVCYFVAAGFVLGILRMAVDIALPAADELGTFVKMTLPAYIGVTAAAGINLKAAQAVFLVMTNVVTSYAGGFMINSFLYIGILSVISNMSEQIHINGLIGIFRQVMFWALGFLLTVFAGMTTLSGLNASATSGYGIRAVKYTIGRTVPLVGGFLADSAELVFSSAAIFKNAFGTVGIIIMFLMILIPVLKLFVVGFVLKFTAGLTEPFCDKRMCNTIYAAGQTVIYIMITLILMAVMFILAFAVLLNVNMV